VAELIVEVVAIDDIKEHPNADRLELAEVKGWQCVVGKGQFKPGDYAVYLPIDSILPDDLEQRLFPPDAKVKLKKSRIRTAKIRGAISQGMLVDLEVCGLDPAQWKPGMSVMEKLGVTKYEPPTKDAPGYVKAIEGNRKGFRNPNPFFAKYTDMQHLQNRPRAIAPAEDVMITEKIHGTSFRCGWVEGYPVTLWQKIKDFFGILGHQFVVGSRNCEITARSKTFYGDDVYSKIAKRYMLKELLGMGVVIYGEIYGDGIQKGYCYGMLGDIDLVVYEVKVRDKWMNPDEAREFCELYGLPFVPVLYRGPLGETDIKEHMGGPSVLNPVQKVREGCVVRSITNDKCYAGRTVFKCINPEYLLSKNNTDWH